jgi:DNA gyrase subunit A
MRSTAGLHPGDELMVITREGIVNRQPVDGIRVIGRNTQGVRLINLSARDAVMDVARVVSENAEVEATGEGGEPGGPSLDALDGALTTEDPGIDALLDRAEADEDFDDGDMDGDAEDEELDDET